MNSRKRPRVEIPDYRGPYPRRMLEDARATLMNTINYKDTMMWSRIKSKVGILPNGDRQTDFQGYGKAATEFSHADFVKDAEATGSRAASASCSDHPRNSRINNVPDRPAFDELLSKSLEDVANTMDKTSAETDCIVLDEDENPDASIVTIDSESTGDLTDKNASIVTIESDSDTEIGKNVIAKGGSKNKDCTDDSIIIIDETDHTGIKDEEMKNESQNIESNKFDDIPVNVTISLSATGQEKHSVGIVGSEKSSAKTSQRTSTSTGTPDGRWSQDKSEDELSNDNGDNDDDDEDSDYDGDAAIANDIRNFKNGYKCDYCNMVSVSKELVVDHMKKNHHNSASHVLMDATSKPVFLRLPEALKEQTDKEAVVAICPDLTCHQAFKSVSVCSEHYIHFHDAKSEPIYATASVESQETLFYELQAGPGPNNPHEEYSLSPAETEYVKKENASAYPCFVCSVCNWMLCSHSQTVNHLKKHRTSKLQRIAVTLLWIPIKPSNKQIRSILPFPNEKWRRSASVKCKIKILQLLKKNSTAPGSRRRKELNKRRRCLRMLLKTKKS